MQPLLAPLALAAIALVSSCGPAKDERPRLPAPPSAPLGWGPVKSIPEGPWTVDEAGVLSAALFLFSEALPLDDARRDLVTSARYVAMDSFAPEDGSRPASGGLGVGPVRSAGTTRTPLQVLAIIQ